MEGNEREKKLRTYVSGFEEASETFSTVVSQILLKFNINTIKCRCKFKIRYMEGPLVVVWV